MRGGRHAFAVHLASGSSAGSGTHATLPISRTSSPMRSASASRRSQGRLTSEPGGRRGSPSNIKPRRGGAFLECRRRDSNPRHADYDSHEAKVRRPCKSIGNGSSKSRRADECANNCTTFVTEMGLSRAPRSGRLRSVSGCRSSRSSVARCAEIATLRHRFSGVQRPSGLPC
jgi:hypothetical protein